MDAFIKELKEANPKLQYGFDEHCGYFCVNGIKYRGDEYWELKYPVKSKRPTIIEKLETERIEWHTEVMSKVMAEHAKKIRAKKGKVNKVKLFLAKMVKDRKRRTIEGAHRTKPVPTIPPPSTSKPSQETINILPTAPESELKLNIDPNISVPMALPKPTWKIINESPASHEPDPPMPAPEASDVIQDTTEVQDRARPRIKRKIYRPNVKYKEVVHLLATTEGDHQLVTSEGDKNLPGDDRLAERVCRNYPKCQPTGHRDKIRRVSESEQCTTKATLVCVTNDDARGCMEDDGRDR